MQSNVTRIQSGLIFRWQWFVDYVGPGNCIWIAWNDVLINVDILNVGSQFVHRRVLIHDLHEPILTTVVYGANDVSARRELWHGLIELARTVGNVPWLVGGDFNAVLDMSEVSGSSGDIRVAMNEFNDCILQTSLLSFPMQGERFTWHNCSLDGRSLWKRLDRLFVNDVWMDRWPNLTYTCLTPRTSDHSPLVLKGGCRNMHVSLFQFDNYIALSPGFLASVHSVWRHPVVGFLEVAQNILQLDRHNSLLSHLEHCCRLVFLKATKLEQVMLRQRAKLEWLKGGDQCSKVFFRRWPLGGQISGFFQIADDDGNEHTDPTFISSVFVDFFRGLLGGARTERALDLQYLRPWARHILTEEEAQAIIRLVTIDEVKSAIFNIEEDKAPGPDGFSSGFFKAAWPIIGEEVSKAIIDFFTTGCLLKQLNATLLTLIPKVRTPHSVADFRPICCCNVIYKVITKIMVSRIREILDLLISPSQNAFVPGRLISDNVLLAQEFFSGYNQCRLPPRCALKVDLRKAYDTVEWDFLFATLRMFGFPAVFIRWIEECVTLAHYSVGVNGGVHGFFAGKIDSRIKGWEGVQLSFTGRVQLIKSVLVSLEVYWAMAFILPKGTIKEMIKRLRTFLWKGTSSSSYPKSSNRIKPRFGLIGSSRFDFGTVRFGQLRKIKELGVGVKCSHFVIHFCLISTTVGNVVMKDGQWNWPLITDIACLEIAHMLPPIFGGPDRINWKSNDGYFNSSTAYDLFHPPGPKVFWSSLLLGPFKIPKNCYILWLAIMGRLSTLDKPWLQHIGAYPISLATLGLETRSPNGRHPDGVESTWLMHISLFIGLLGLSHLAGTQFKAFPAK
ncbi:hypothetical protein Sango_3077900 [Sesamum angolense]|uniref:Reverse transcriptase domain-containing protein n=1 Tax=Sesamum angolense TaxID=2727404 RepID=A0AAE1W188_9LAMI|nr:hypothetical protein Sango_3077900 [Sesamum angolense]